MTQPYARVNQPYATLTLASALREMFGVQLYKNNARALLSCILSILNLDWLQHARSVRGVYECTLSFVSGHTVFFFLLSYIVHCNSALGPQFCANKIISYHYNIISYITYYVEFKFDTVMSAFVDALWIS